MSDEFSNDLRWSYNEMTSIAGITIVVALRPDGWVASTQFCNGERIELEFSDWRETSAPMAVALYLIVRYAAWESLGGRGSPPKIQGEKRSSPASSLQQACYKRAQWTKEALYIEGNATIKGSLFRTKGGQNPYVTLNIDHSNVAGRIVTVLDSNGIPLTEAGQLLDAAERLRGLYLSAANHDSTSPWNAEWDSGFSGLVSELDDSAPVESNSSEKQEGSEYAEREFCRFLINLRYPIEPFQLDIEAIRRLRTPLDDIERVVASVAVIMNHIVRPRLPNWIRAYFEYRLEGDEARRAGKQVQYACGLQSRRPDGKQMRLDESSMCHWVYTHCMSKYESDVTVLDADVPNQHREQERSLLMRPIPIPCNGQRTAVAVLALSSPKVNDFDDRLRNWFSEIEVLTTIPFLVYFEYLTSHLRVKEHDAVEKIRRGLYEHFEPVQRGFKEEELQENLELS